MKELSKMCDIAYRAVICLVMTTLVVGYLTSQVYNYNEDKKLAEHLKSVIDTAVDKVKDFDEERVKKTLGSVIDAVTGVSADSEGDVEDFNNTANATVQGESERLVRTSEGAGIAHVTMSYDQEFFTPDGQAKAEAVPDIPYAMFVKEADMITDVSIAVVYSGIDLDMFTDQLKTVREQLNVLEQLQEKTPTAENKDHVWWKYGQKHPVLTGTMAKQVRYRLLRFEDQLGELKALQASLDGSPEAKAKFWDKYGKGRRPRDTVRGTVEFHDYLNYPNYPNVIDSVQLFDDEDSVDPEPEEWDEHHRRRAGNLTKEEIIEIERKIDEFETETIKLPDLDQASAKLSVLPQFLSYAAKGIFWLQSILGTTGFLWNIFSDNNYPDQNTLSKELPMPVRGEKAWQKNSLEHLANYVQTLKSGVEKLNEYYDHKEWVTWYHRDYSPSRHRDGDDYSAYINSAADVYTTGIHSYFDHSEAILDAVSQAFGGTVPIKLFPPKEVFKALSQISTNKYDYYQPIIADPFSDLDSFYRLKAYPVFKGGQILIATVVPMLNKHEKYQVFRYLKDKTHVTSEGLNYAIDNPKNLIVVDRRQAHHLEINQEDMSDCQKILSTYLCPNKKVLTKENSCLYALFTNDREQIVKLCSFKFQVTQGTHLTQLGPRTFAVNTNRRHAVRLECSSMADTHSVSVMAGKSILAVPMTCSANIDNFYVAATSGANQSHVGTGNGFIRSPWLDKPRQLFELIADRYPSIDFSQEGLEAVAARLGDYGMSLSFDDLQLESTNGDYQIPINVVRTGGGASAVIVLLIMLAILLLLGPRGTYECVQLILWRRNLKDEENYNPENAPLIVNKLSRAISRQALNNDYFEHASVPMPSWMTRETQPSDLESFSSPYKPISESVLENPSELSRSIAELTVAMENSSLDNGSSLPRSVLKSSSARISDSTGAIPKVVSVDKPIALPRSQGPQPWPRANVEVENTL